MDYGRPALADRLAAEYVLGTLRGPARRRFEALLPAHPALGAAVRDWQARLDPMASAVAAVTPPPAVWAGVERVLFGAAAAPLPWWRRVGSWQGLTGAATAAALALAVLLAQPPAPSPPPIVVVLSSAGGDAGTGAAASASFVASVAADGRSLVLKPIGPMRVGADRALELWAVPGAGAPRSLGLVSPDAATTVLRARLLDGTAAFAVSVEPPGGSPTGAPTGPIVSLGKLQS